MVLALSLLVALQGKGDGDPVLLALRYLARHQAKDGMWGRRSTDCVCPAEPAPSATPLDPATRDRLRILLDDLELDDPERRNAAQRELTGFGPPALPLLREAAAAGGAERRARLRDVLSDIGRSGTQEDVEVTGWCLLVFLGAGYSPLSKDVHDGRDFGTLVGEGLQALLDRQDARGGFGAPGCAAHAVATLAVSEAYGLTCRQEYREPAQKAIDLLGANPAKGARPLAWQVMALKSAELGDLRFPRAAYDESLRRMARLRAAEPGSAFVRAANVMSSIFILKSKADLDVTGLMEVDPSKLELDAAYLNSLAAFQYDGPGGASYKRYRQAEKAWILPLQAREPGLCERGSWPAEGTRARLQAACHAALLNEVYYAYSSNP